MTQLIKMKLWSVSLFGAVAVISIVLAVATVWLFLTDPVTVATSVSQGEITPLVQDLALDHSTRWRDWEPTCRQARRMRRRVATQPHADWELEDTCKL